MAASRDTVGVGVTGQRQTEGRLISSLKDVESQVNENSAVQIVTPSVQFLFLLSEVIKYIGSPVWTAVCLG